MSNQNTTAMHKLPENWELIFDNGGGATLQTNLDVNGIEDHAFYFPAPHMGDLALTVKACLAGEDASLWDGNDAGNRAIWWDEESHSQNCGYFVLPIVEIGEHVEDLCDWGYNASKFTQAFLSLGDEEQD